MMNLRKLVPWIVLALSFPAFATAGAKGIVKVTLAGPGLPAPVERTDPAALELFGDFGSTEQIAQPASAGAQPYFEIRVSLGAGNEIVAVDVFHYYPASGGQAGYFYYADVINGSSTAEGAYFRLSQETDRELREFLGGLGASLPEAQAGGAADPGRDAPLWILPAVLLGAAGLLALFRGMRRALNPDPPAAGR